MLRRMVDVEIGPDGTIYSLGNVNINGGNTIWKYDSKKLSWNKLDFGARRMSVGSNGKPYVVTRSNKIFWPAEFCEETAEAPVAVWKVPVGPEFTPVPKPAAPKPIKKEVTKPKPVSKPKVPTIPKAPRQPQIKVPEPVIPEIAIPEPTIV